MVSKRGLGLRSAEEPKYFFCFIFPHLENLFFRFNLAIYRFHDIYNIYNEAGYIALACVRFFLLIFFH